MIYKAAFGTIGRPHHLFLGPFPQCRAADDGVARVRQTVTDDGLSRLEVDFYRRHPAKYALARTACKGPLEDDGRELRARRLASGLPVSRTNRPRRGADDPGSHRDESADRDVKRASEATRRQGGSDTDVASLVRSPVPLLQVCRRVREDVAPHCYHSISLSDLGTAAKFLTQTRGLNGLWRDSVRKLSVDVVLQRADSQAHKAVQIWRYVCEQLSGLSASGSLRLKAFRARVEIPADNSPSFVKHMESKGKDPLEWSNRWLVMMLDALEPLYSEAGVLDVEVEVSYIPVWFFDEQNPWLFRALGADVASNEAVILEGGYELKRWKMNDGCEPAAGFWRLDPWWADGPISGRITESRP